jgi:hypothetical protein
VSVDRQPDTANPACPRQRAPGALLVAGTVALGLLVVAIDLGATVRSGVGESSAYRFGRVVGHLIVLGIVLGLFAVFPRFRNPRSLTRVAFWTLLAVVLSTCAQRRTRELSDRRAAAAAQARALDYVSPSAAQLEAFGRALEQDLAAGEEDALASRFDVDAVIARALVGVPEDLRLSRSARQFAAGVESGLTADRGGLATVQEALSQGAFRRILDVDGEQRLLFRVIYGDGEGFEYYELVCGARDGETKIVDYMSYTAGEFVSEVFRQVYLRALDQHDKGALGRVLGNARSDLVEHMGDLRSIHEQLTAGRGQAAWAALERLPASLRETKPVLLLRLRAASLVGDDAYAGVLEAIARSMPEEDPCREVLLLDWHWMHGEFDAVVEGVARVRRGVGTDGFLRTLQAAAMQEKGDLAAAIAFADLAVTEEPGLELARRSAVTLRLGAGDYEDVVEALGRLRAHAPVGPDWLAALEGGADFLASEEGRRWLSTLGDAETGAEGGPGTGR